MRTMSTELSQGVVKHLLLRNQSPFDATLQLVDLSSPTSAFPLGPDLRAGDSIVFQLVSVPGLANANGMEFSVKLINKRLKEALCAVRLTYTNAAPPVRKARFVLGGSMSEPKIQYTGFTDVEIPAEILDDSEFKARYKLVDNKPIPNPPRSLTEKFRWIQCVVKNQTQFRIELQDSHTYIDSGRYWTPPTSVEPFDQMVFSCCNGDYSVAGATGGTALKMVLDPVTSYDIALGWTTPFAGGFKASIVNSVNPRDGYEKATLEGNAFTSSEKFRGLQESGNPTEWHLHLSAAAGQYMIYVITVVRAS